MNAKPKIIIIAGPNGAGKTTFAAEYLPKEAGCFDFINADLIAGGLSPFRPDAALVRAGRLMLNEISDRIEQRASFAFETTLSGRLYSKRIPEWRIMGYHVKLVYLRLDSVEIAISRVAARVIQGGHSIPEDVIRRRFERSWENFTLLASGMVDSWILYDNTGETPVLVKESD